MNNKKKCSNFCKCATTTTTYIRARVKVYRNVGGKNICLISSCEQSKSYANASTKRRHRAYAVGGDDESLAGKKVTSYIGESHKQIG